jgi:hypothetical protein
VIVGSGGVDAAGAGGVDAGGTGGSATGGTGAGAAGTDDGGDGTVDADGETAGAGGMAAEDAAADAADADGSAGCPVGLPGPALVDVPATDGSRYCIDSTEVTNAQYAAFLAAGVPAQSVTADPPYCAWNATYAPSSAWPAAGRDDYPVAYVDWCDAYAFCAWAGKRLCGKIGGGPFPTDGTAELVAEQMYNACSSGGTMTYPYGSIYYYPRCNGVDYGAGGTLPVATAGAWIGANMRWCEGGYRGIFDMSGNVSEWYNSCFQFSDGCYLFGGSFGSDWPTLQCGGGSYAPRSYSSDSVGFRCCKG